MSSISTSIIKNYYYELKKEEAQAAPIRLSEVAAPFDIRRINLLADRASLQLPGVASVITAPIDFVATSVKLVKSHCNKDHTQAKALSLQLAGNALSFSYAAASVAEAVISIGQYFSLFTWQFAPLANTVTGLGALLCSVESFLEIWGIKRIIDTKSQLKTIQSSTPDFIAKERCVENLTYLHNKYLSVSKTKCQEIYKRVNVKYPDLTTEEKASMFERYVTREFKLGYRKLVSRVRPLMAEKILIDSGDLISRLQSKNPRIASAALDEARELFNDIDTQFKKAILIHVIGLIALGGTIVSLGLAGLGLPIWGILIIGVSITGIALTRLVLHRCLLEEKGWHFNVRKIPSCFIPEVVINKAVQIYREKIKKINPKEIEMVPLCAEDFHHLKAS